MSSRHLAYRVFGCALVALLATASSLFAGQLLLQKLEQVIVVDDTPVFLMPDATRIPLRTLGPGSDLEVFSAEGSWLKVRFRDAQYGQRVGYIESKHLQRQLPPVEVKSDAEDSTTAPQPQPTGSPAQSSAPVPQEKGEKGVASGPQDRPQANEGRQAPRRKQKKANSK